MTPFQEKFEILRRRGGLTIRDVASALNVGVGTVGGWTNGAKPRPEVAKRLADFFEISVEILLDDSRKLPTSTWDKLHVAEEAAYLKYGALNPQAKDENFDAQMFERLLQEERQAHAASLRQVAETLAARADEYLTRAKKLETRPGSSVTTNPKPKPNAAEHKQAREAAQRRLHQKTSSSESRSA